VLRVEQTLTCDICGKKMNSLTQFVHPGTAMQMIARGPVGVTQWQDICIECSDPLMKAFVALKTAKAAE
jgi:hypothetical protein